MSKSNKFSPEAREHAVRMAQEHRGEDRRYGRASSLLRPRLDACRGTLHAARCTSESNTCDPLKKDEARRTKSVASDAITGPQAAQG